MKLRVLDLFSGIGGFSLGLERTGGFETVAFCEIEEFPRKVLAKHWPEIYCHHDVTKLTKETLCRGYAENALINQLCRETGGNLASVKNVIEIIKESAEKRTLTNTTNGQQSVEKALSTIIAESARVAEKPSTLFWQSITLIMTETTSEKNTRELHGKSLSHADFLTVTKFFVTTATWQKPFTVPAPIKKQMRETNHDVTTADFESIGPVDVVTGGFPCQDISFAGKGAGLTGERSGLFWSILPTLRMVGWPRLVLENVAALLNRGLSSVLGALAQIGYDAEWHCIPARYVGAPHGRDRIWIIADPNGSERRAKPYCWTLGRMGGQQQSVSWDVSWEAALSKFRRVDDGLPRSVASTDGYRNAVVPQIPEMIGHAILEAEGV